MATGLFRVTIAKQSGQEYYKYQIRNRLINDSIMSNNILELKRKVIEKGYLWGIINKEEAQEIAKKDNIKPKDLQGRYGEQFIK